MSRRGQETGAQSTRTASSTALSREWTVDQTEMTSTPGSPGNLPHPEMKRKQERWDEDLTQEGKPGICVSGP